MPDGRDQRGQDHEQQEDPGELDVLARPLLDLLPHDRVRRRPGRAPLRLLGVARESGVDLLQHDRAVLVDLERLEIGKDHARVLARDIREDDVAVGALRRDREPDDVEHGGRALEHPHDLVGAVGRRDDPQVHHGGGQPTRAAARPRPPTRPSRAPPDARRAPHPPVHRTHGPVVTRPTRRSSRPPKVVRARSVAAVAGGDRGPEPNPRGLMVGSPHVAGSVRPGS